MVEQLVEGKETLLSRIFEEIHELEKEQKWLGKFDILLKALSIRDLYTEGHSRRVAIYSYLIGKEFGLDKRKLFRLYVGGILHDIGKIGIPDAILLKPIPLTLVERKLVEKHPILGYELLKEKEYEFPFILSIVLKHHERLDGKGYPSGIDYKKIPLTVNIVSIADVFDALTTDRPYKKALSLEETLSTIEEDSRKAFFPEVVEAGIKVFKKIGVLDIYRDSLLTEDLEKFRKEAFFTDVVTGLPTFSRWKEKFAAIHKEDDIAFVAFDIKGLLFINLSRGWEKGDEILGDIGRELQKNKLGDFCRFTGGTFLGIVSRRDLSKFLKVLNIISGKHRIMIHEVILKRKSIESVEKLVAILVKKLREKKSVSFTSGGIEKLVRRHQK